MRRVLLVTSSYAPVTIADMHRVRHLAWDLYKLGWDAEILVPGLEFQRPDCFEPESAPLFNPEVECHEVTPRDFKLFSLLNVRSIGWRALRPMADRGAELLRRKSYDLIYISTANFNLFCLGRWWSREFNIPYVLDYHDPWVRDQIDYSTTSNPLKRWLSAKLSGVMESYALKGAAGVVSVSPVYLDELRQRYGNLRCLQADRSAFIPFAAREADLQPTGQSIEPANGKAEIIYVGAGGAIMAKSFSAICAAVAEVRRTEPELVENLKIRLLGTYAFWKDGESKPLQEIAAGFGLADIVEEIPPRITYLKALEYVQRSNGLLLLGVNDKGYVPSKLFTYALSGKPLLACFHAGSPSAQLFQQMPGIGRLLTFGQVDVSPTVDAVTNVRDFLLEVGRGQQFDRKALIKSHLSPAMAKTHVELFERICNE